MTQAGRKATAALAVAVTMTVEGLASANVEPIAATDPRERTIVLHVANYRALSRHVLDEPGSRREGLRGHRCPHRMGRER